MSLLRWRTRAALVLTLVFAVLGTSTALAHEGRDVGDYNFVVGFINEPAVEGMLNGVSLRVTSLIVEEEDHSDHDAGMDMGDGMAMSGDIDLVSHGGVFVDELAAGASYEFMFNHDYENLTVPFHAHRSKLKDRSWLGTRALMSPKSSSKFTKTDSSQQW